MKLNPGLLRMGGRCAIVIPSSSSLIYHDPPRFDLKTALGKKRKDGKSAPPQPLTTMQHEHILPLIEKCGDDYEMIFRDTKVNAMQHSVATLKNLCRRYCEDQYPFILGK